MILMTDESHLPINDQLSIPLAELHFRFTPSGGPGGQHANRSATRVELLFDVAGSPSLNDEQRQRILTALGTYIDSEGTLRLVSRASRSQLQNRQDVTARFQALLARSLRPRKHRRPSRVPRAERARRLAQKRQHSEKKRFRKPPTPED